MLVHPTAIPSEISCVSASPRVIGFLDFEDTAAAAKAPAHFDYRHQSLCVRLIQARYSEKSHVLDLFVTVTSLGIGSVRLNTTLRFPCIVARKQPVSLGN